MKYKSSELIINEDGSVFHLHMKPGEVAQDIILVGDPKRVDLVSSFFDQVHFQSNNREFVSRTGTYKNKLFTVISTGIGTDNIDIVINELDALFSIDFTSRMDIVPTPSLNLIRIGTSGAIQPDIDPGSVVYSEYSIGFDGLLNFYQDRDQVTTELLEIAFIEASDWSPLLARPYAVAAAPGLVELMPPDYLPGITLSANGFYAPQIRQLRAKCAFPDFIERIEGLEFNGHRITNFEMECSALYGLGSLLGYQALTVCGIIANRRKTDFFGDYETLMLSIIETVLNSLVTHE